MTKEIAIEIFNEVLLFGKARCTQAEFKELTEMSIQALEQKPRWIPVSERLPEDSGEYLVTIIDDLDYKDVGVAYFAHPKDYSINKGEWRELRIYEKVIAWMPLPKAYSEVEE